MDDDEDWLRGIIPSLSEVTPDAKVKKRQKKVVTLDDLLEADHKETVRKLKTKVKRNKLSEKQKARSHLYKSSSEGEEEDQRIPNLRMEFDNLEKQVTVSCEEELEPEWGAPVFAAQLEFPSLVSLSTCAFFLNPKR